MCPGQCCLPLGVHRLPCGIQGTAVRLSATDCSFSLNEASGLWLLAGAHGALVRCGLFDNGCNGAACWDCSSCLLLRDCVCNGNMLNGVRLLHASKAVLQATRLDSNTEHGLEVGYEASAELRECIIHGVPYARKPGCARCPTLCVRRHVDSLGTAFSPSHTVPALLLNCVRVRRVISYRSFSFHGSCHR